MNISLGSGELAILMGLALMAILVAAFLALFLSTIIGVGVAQLVYVAGLWCVKRLRESRAPHEIASGARDKISGAKAVSTVPWFARARTYLLHQ